MAFAILRVAKLKTMGNVAGHGDHVERIRETPNAAQELKILNSRITGTADPAADVQTRFEQVGIEPRRGAVVAIDVFISASPEHFKSNHPNDPNWKAFQKRAMDFLQQEYGADNVVHAIAHHDETSPHLHAIVTPIISKTIKVGRKIKTDRVENRLCARDWLGGDRTTLSKLQTRFADYVKDLGLNRGIEGSQADHTEVKQFYTVMKETVSQARVINTKLAPIDADYFVRAVSKPTIFDLTQPRRFAQDQVSMALKNLQQQIQQTNHNIKLAHSGQLAKLQKPAQNALKEKSATRQSQAERALNTLGYRIDQHGELINLIEERNNALRATITASLKDCTNTAELTQRLSEKGIKVGADKERKDGNYNHIYYHNGKNRVYGEELGDSYRMAAIYQALKENQKRQETEKICKEEERVKAELAKTQKAQEKKPEVKPTNVFKPKL